MFAHMFAVHVTAEIAGVGVHRQRFPSDVLVDAVGEVAPDGRQLDGRRTAASGRCPSSIASRPGWRVLGTRDRIVSALDDHAAELGVERRRLRAGQNDGKRRSLNSWTTSGAVLTSPTLQKLCMLPSPQGIGAGKRCVVAHGAGA